MNGKLVGLIAILAGSFGTARADENAWGTAEDAENCVKELTKDTKEWVNGGWMSWTKGAAHAPANASAECKAEIDKRAEGCLKDPDQQKEMEKRKKDPKSPIAKLLATGDAGAQLFCADQAWWRLHHQRDKAAENKKFEDRRQAAAAAAEMPKPGKKDGTIESLVTASFKKEFPEAKILKVVIVSDDWTNEKDDWGHVIGHNIQVAVVNKPKDAKELCEIFSEAWFQEMKGGKFGGPLSERGAGSLQKTEILCTKVK